MKEKRDFIKETFERIKLGKKSKDSEKKKRLSRIILFLDIVIIVFILAFFNRKTPRSLYHTTSLKYSGFQYRFSLLRENKSKDYLISTTIISNSKNEKDQYYSQSIAHLTIQHGESIVYKTSIGDNITNIKLYPGESKTFVKEIDEFHFRDYSNKHPESIISTDSSIFMKENMYIPLQANITLNTKEVISTSLNFNYRLE